MVRMFPKRNSVRLGVKPGLINMNIIPKAIPKAQNAAIAESSLTLYLDDKISTPNAEATANMIAVITGFIPRKKPIPSPPKEA